MRINRLYPILALIPAVFFQISANAASVARKIDSKSYAILNQHRIYFEIARDHFSTFDKNQCRILDQPDRSASTFSRRHAFTSMKNVYLIPFEYTSCELRKKILAALFPEDRQTTTEWIHKVKYTGSDGESLWRIAEWFTGSGSNASVLSDVNKIRPERLAAGNLIKIPSYLLQSCFAPATPPEQKPTKDGDLIFKTDTKGKYAEYILRGGQTIYSDVVIRFTPRVTAAEVMEAASVILERSELKNFHDIPADKHLRIPQELLSPQFLPPDDPLRIQYEQTMKAAQQYKKSVSSETLEGVSVILDSGHGGVDPGTIGLFDVYEDEYVYDILCRTKKLLETTTKAKVYTTISDDETGFGIRDQKKLSSQKNKEKILVTPPYYLDDVKTGLNMRMYLSNYYFEQHNTQKNSDEKCIFISLHADSLHPNTKGVMIYIPGADYYTGSYSRSGKIYTSRKEIKGRTTIKMTRQARLRAEGFSQSLAECYLDACKHMSVVTHSNQPIRKYIVRGKSSWVPFVLKYCKIPTRLLIEVANLKNTDDCNRIRDAKYRQKLAEVTVAAIKGYFSNNAKK